MSKYSGKCDFADTVEIMAERCGKEIFLSKYKVYFGDNFLPLAMNEPRDVIPYYPYLVGAMGSSKEDGGNIYLSTRSFVDTEEEKTINWYLQDILKYWRRCKRKKIPFEKEEAHNHIILGFDQELENELIDRVALYGDKTSIDGIHLKLHDSYRKELYDDMIAAGFEEDKTYRWCYGWRRWLERNRSPGETGCDMVDGRKT